MKVIGIDLAGKPKNPTGFCVFESPGKSSPLGRVETKLIFSDQEILSHIENEKPDCIAIDAPFWLPIQGNQIATWRPPERELLKKGFHPLSTALPTMRDLSLRASHLVKILRERNYQVIEVFTRASERILNLSKKPKKNQDEYDALICALTAKAFLEKNYEDLGGIIIPK